MRISSVVVCLVIMTESLASANTGARFLQDAMQPAETEKRDMALVIGFARRFANEYSEKGSQCSALRWGSKEEDTERHSVAVRQVAMLAATTYILKHEQRFTQAGYGWLVNKIKANCGVAGWNELVSGLHEYLKTVYVLGDVGTSYRNHQHDYDMTLMGLIHLMFLFIDDDVTMPDEVGYAILCQNGDGYGCENSEHHTPRWDGIGGYLTFQLMHDFRTKKLTAGIGRTETENHVLMIYTWNYLASLWILARGPNTTHPGLRRMYEKGVAWLSVRENQVSFFENLMQALGRPVHAGYFETNARPYQSLTLNALMALILYADIDMLLPENTVDRRIKNKGRLVRQAALNAFNYAAAKFAFQSLRTMRSAPMRRGHKNRHVADFYKSNRGALMFGLLSGAYEYEDCTDDRFPCVLFRYPRIEGNHELLWAALGRMKTRRLPYHGGYELPEAIWGHMYDDRAHFAIFQARSWYEQHPLTVTGFENFYFESTGDPPQIFKGPDKNFRGSPELYFRTSDIMLSAGGFKQRWAKGSNDVGGSAEWQYNFWARPTMLFWAGNYGYSKAHEDFLAHPSQAWGGYWDGSDLHLLMMRGIRNEPCMSRCNTWVYKNFVYGYEYKHTVGGDYHTHWAQQYPQFWDDAYLVAVIEAPYDAREQQVHFRVFHFPYAPGSLYADSRGYYMVMAKVRKRSSWDSSSRDFYNYRRGFVEIIPEERFGSIRELREDLLAWNNPRFNYYPKNDNQYYKYVTLTGHERLTLDPRMGWGGPIDWEDCDDGIRRIETLVDPSLGPEGSKESWRWTLQDTEGLLLPQQLKDNKTRAGIPLVRVWELDGRYRQTGKMLMESPKAGRVIVRRRTEVGLATEDSGWQCLVLDSSNYRRPFSEEYEVTDYRDCGDVPDDLVPYQFLQVSAGQAHTCGVAKGQELFCWGENEFWQLGVGGIPVSSAYPLQVEDLVGVEQVSAGARHTCAVTQEGRLYCWGYGRYGQRGDGTTSSTSLPVAVSFPDPSLRVTSVAAGDLHTCALSNQGSVWCFGANSYGQLGPRSSDFIRVTPLNIPLPEPATAITAGGFHTCALMVGGGLYCWGRSDMGQVGDGTVSLVHRDPAAAILPEDRMVVTQAAAGRLHTCAVVEPGYPGPEVYCWGSNQGGQLGLDLPESEYASLPVRSEALDLVDALPASLTAGQRHTCAVTRDGEGWCWGLNDQAQLGDPFLRQGTRTFDAVQVGLVEGVRAATMDASFDHTCLIDREQRAIWCFGADESGQVGDGSASTAPEHVAKPVNF